MTPEQQRAIALAAARRRRAEAEQQGAQASPATQEPQAQPYEQQIVGGVVMPPPVEMQQPGQDPSWGVRDYVRAGSDAAFDIAGAGAAGVGRGITSLVDLPGAVFGGAGNLAAAGVEKLGAPGVAQGVRDSFGMMPMGDGGLFRGAASEATGGASDYRGDSRAARFAGTAGEFLPGAALFGGTGAGNLIRYGAVPGVASEAAGQLTEGTAVEPYARVAAALLAAPLANAAEKGVRKLISPHGGADQGRLALAQALDDAGVPVSAGQRVGSESLRRKEGLTEAGRRLNDTQKEALTTAAMKTAGSDASRATPEALRETAQRIGRDFDDAVAGLTIRPSANDIADISAAADVYRSLAPSGSRAPLIDSIAEAMVVGQQGGIPAKAAGTWRSQLSKLTTSPDPATREAAVQALDVLDNSMATALQAAGRADDVAKLATAREQWRNFLAIQKAASGAGEKTALGVLSPSALRSAVASQGRNAYAQGRRGDLGLLSRAGEAVMKDLPTSGTAENLRAMGIPTAGWMGAGGASGSLLGGAPGAAIGAIAGSMAPQALGALRMSKPVQAYLANQLMGSGPAVLGRGAFSPVAAALATYQRQTPGEDQ